MPLGSVGEPVPAEVIVAAIGQTWPDLAIEQAVLAPQGIEIVDARGIAGDDPLWSKLSGVLLGTAHKLDAAALAALPRCRGVVRYGIGYDNVDVDAASKLGMQVAIVRDYCIDEVAEHALACALALTRGLPHWDRNMRAGAWRSGDRPRLRKLSSLAFGIVGFGLIGRTVAAKASGLFGRVLVHDPIAQPTDADRAAGYEFVALLNDLLGAIDVLSVHVPLTDGTRALIDADALARMKPSAYVINVSRGGIVDEGALLDAVRSDRIAGAALDTFVKEPLPAENPLMQEPRILLSPHVAWLSEEAEIKLRQRASEELALILEGRAPASPVGPVRAAATS